MSTLFGGFRRRLALAFILALAVPALAMATSGSQQTLAGLTKVSSEVVRGRVVSKESRWNEDRTLIVTDVVLQVTETFKGQAGSEVTLEVLGGQVEDLALDIVGGASFKLGEEVLVFAARGPDQRLRIPGLAQAKFTVETDADGKVWIHNPISIERFLSGEAKAVDAAGRLEWGEFRGRLTGTIERQRQGGVR
jgi:hypothetical protein